MGNIKKLIISLLIVLVGSLLFINQSNAAETRYFSYSDLCYNTKLLCVQHHQTMVGGQYRLISTVNITGNKSSGNGHIVENWHNAKLVSILSHNRGIGNYGGNDVEGLAVQNAIWNYFKTWIEKVGVKHGISSSFVNGYKGNYTPQLEVEATNYANNYKNDSDIEDKTDDSKVKATAYLKDDKKYLRVGPFKYKFSDSLSGISVNTDKNKNVKVVAIEKKTSSNSFSKYSSVKDIKSNDQFYISIKLPTDGSQYINNINLKYNKSVKKVKINFWEHIGQSQQNLLEYTHSTDKETIEKTFSHKIKFFGDLKVIKVDKKNNEVKLKGVTFKIYNEGLKKYVRRETKDNVTTIKYVNKESNATLFKTGKNGEILIKGLLGGTYIAYEKDNPNYGYKILDEGKRKTVVVDKTAELKIPNQKITGNLRVIKVDAKNHEIRLSGVEFKIKQQGSGKYVKKSKSGDISYVDESKATIFKTDKNGEILIKNLIKDSYEAIEVKNPNEGYQIINDGKTVDVVVDKTVDFVKENLKSTINISGYVWVDKATGKKSVRNNLYKQNGEYTDDQDVLLDGITVRLMRKGNKVAETKTSALNRYRENGNGEYLFNDVAIYDERGNNILNEYYIEFEYDGLTYQNVQQILDKDNGSKAIEGYQQRDQFNKGFANIEGKLENTGKTTNSKGQEIHELKYYKDKTKHISTLDKTQSYFSIVSTTEASEYNIKDHYDETKDEIKNINLGIYEREMPDIMIGKDVQNVELSINGYSHIYEYAKKDLGKTDEKGFNVGVKQASKYTGTYKRAVYQPDYNYTVKNQNEANKLQVYITYRIAMYNESTNLKARVNSIVDYYDKNFIVDKIGTQIDNNGIISNDINIPQSDVQGKEYNKMIIQSQTEIDSQKEKSIYVRFKLKDSEVIKAFKDNNENFEYKNIAEINSYSTFDKDGKVYAGIDKDSAPANIEPGNVDTYEDDTDRAPGMKLEVKGNREIKGTVFLDESTGGPGEVRLGNGTYNENEKGIAGVKVVLCNEDGTIAKIYNDSDKESETKAMEPVVTDENGQFTISGLIPGKYFIKYTWGDNTYIVDSNGKTTINVNDYKGTIWTSENKAEKEKNRETWYKKNIDTRYSDAMDNYETRKKIDAGAEDAPKTLDSVTPPMNLDFEINGVYSTVENVDEFIPEGYQIRNIDFGIVERPRQEIAIDKKVNSVKVTLANGQVLVDATIDADGNLSSNSPYLIYNKPDKAASPVNGLLWVQLDNELIQGATVEVEYKIEVKNNSEIDYDSDQFYLYGTKTGNIIKITPSGVYDYLSGMQLNPNKEKENSEWKIISREEYNNKYTNDTITEKYYTTRESTETDENGNIINKKDWELTELIQDAVIEEWTSNTTESRTIRENKLLDKLILHNEELEKELEPGQSNIVSLFTSKQLSSSDEINLNNDVEITEIKETPDSGRRVNHKTLVYRAQSIQITPPTGENHNYILIVGTLISSLVTLGVGVIFIKRKTL